ARCRRWRRRRRHRRRRRATRAGGAGRGGVGSAWGWRPSQRLLGALILAQQALRCKRTGWRWWAAAVGDFATLTAIPAAGPSDAATEALVHDIRSRADAWATSTGADVSGAGETAVAIDVSQTLSDALIPYLVVIVGLAFVLLTLVFRSLLVPLKATLGFLLSVVAAFGAVVSVFQWGWLSDVIGLDTTGPIVSFLPVIMIGLLFGLAMDHGVFLVTRMREAFVHGATPDGAIRDGFEHGAR